MIRVFYFNQGNGVVHVDGEDIRSDNLEFVLNAIEAKSFRVVAVMSRHAPGNVSYEVVARQVVRGQ